MVVERHLTCDKEDIGLESTVGGIFTRIQHACGPNGSVSAIILFFGGFIDRLGVLNTH